MKSGGAPQRAAMVPRGPKPGCVGGVQRQGLGGAADGKSNKHTSSEEGGKMIRPSNQQKLSSSTTLFTSNGVEACELFLPLPLSNFTQLLSRRAADNML
jgi:hypothetical protein